MSTTAAEGAPGADRLRIVYVPLDQAQRWEWERNPKRHDLDALIASIARHGFKDPPKFEPALNHLKGGIVAGNGRMAALVEMRRRSMPVPRGVDPLPDNSWAVPVVFGVDADSQGAAEAYGIDANNLTLFGADFGAHDLARLWEKEYQYLLEDLHAQDALPVSVPLSDFELMMQAAEVVKPTSKPNPRVFPFDLIYTLQGADCSCCLAVLAGLRYGIQSASYRLCPYTYELSGRHKVAFIDQDYFHYDHAVHLAAVKKFKPKYTTVKDVMTRQQCAEDGICYSPLEQILDWAEELAEHAENVILIPKYPCLDRIPEKFMLGYSIPTSHGGTPLPLAMFRGRRVHLLGGSWKDQLAYLGELGEDVVSIDNNHVALMARFGQFYLPDGETKALRESGLEELNNPRYAALALSFGAMGAMLAALNPPPDDHASDDSPGGSQPAVTEQADLPPDPPDGGPDQKQEQDTWIP